MPFPLLAHQAVVLPLKLARPAWFSTSALCFGSLAPDLEYLARDRGPGLAHRWSGLWLTTLLATALSLIFVDLVLPVVGSRFPLLRFRPVRTPIAIVASSACVGAGSHLLLDGVTHENGWAARFAPALGHTVSFAGASLTVARAIQYSSSVVLAGITVLVAWRLLRKRDRPEAIPERRGRLVIAVTTSIGAVFGTRGARRLIADGYMYFREPTLHAVGYLAFSVICHAFIGLVLGCLFLRVGDSRRSSLPLPPSLD